MIERAYKGPLGPKWLGGCGGGIEHCKCVCACVDMCVDVCVDVCGGGGLPIHIHTPAREKTQQGAWACTWGGCIQGRAKVEVRYTPPFYRGSGIGCNLRLDIKWASQGIVQTLEQGEDRA